ncbi:MAG: AsmA-like C-terminal region-containing protein, partial [Pseudomonadota bacterium]|nr:AsmA-like C-terminal region-containing protein [Pseudomonadota bacterium]
EASRGTLTLSGWAGGTAFAFRDRFEGRPSRWREAAHDLFAKFEQDDPLVLARQLALPVSPVGAPGPVTVTAEISGRFGEEMSVNLAANAPDTDLSASGQAVFDLRDAETPEAVDAARFGVSRFDLAVTLGTQDIDPWLLMAGYPMPGTGEGHPASLAFQAQGDSGIYRAAGLSGTHGINRFSGDVELDTVRAARPKVSGALNFDLVSAPFAAELLLGAGTVAGDGFENGIADRQFGLPMIEGVDAELKLSSERLETGGGPQANAFSADAVLIDGALSLPQFSAGWAGGTLTGNLALRNASGNATLNTQVTLAGVDATALARMAGFSPAVRGKADIGMTLDAGGRSFKGLVSALTGSGVFRLENAVLEGVTTAGLEDILEQADREGFEITAANVRPLAEAAMLRGSMEAESVSGTFSVGRGLVSARNVELDDDDGTLEASGSYNPVTGETRITATLKLDPGDAALSGADPAADLEWDGTPGTLVARLDSQALEGYLSLRAYEREQRKVEILQETVLEKQRLRRETILTRTRMARREAAREEELRRLERLQQQLLPGPDDAAREGLPEAGPDAAPETQPGTEAGAIAVPAQETAGEDAPIDIPASGRATSPGGLAAPASGFQLPAGPENTPVPEPSPSRIGIVQPSQERNLPVVEAQPLSAPDAGAGETGDRSDLFEEIRRKLFGEEDGR